MAKKKAARGFIVLEYRSEAGTYRYLTQKNRKNTTNRLSLKKYCPLTRKHEMFKEIKQQLKSEFSQI